MSNIDNNGKDRNNHDLWYVALHLTDECGHKCPMCYLDAGKGADKVMMPLDRAKFIIEQLKDLGTPEVLLVGGDPAKYKHIGELTKFLYNMGLNANILSNTHEYPDITMQEMSKYATQLDTTIHAALAKHHDAFCGQQGAMHAVIEKMKIFDNERNRETQKVGITLNMMKHNYAQLYDIVESVLAQKLNIDSVSVQRIAPYGRGSREQQIKANTLNIDEINRGFEEINKINKVLGIPTVMVDAFPFCQIDAKYHPLIEKCLWGHHIASIDVHGGLSRCAVQGKAIGNVFVSPISKIWEESPELIGFREGKHLEGTKCSTCDYLEKCGGGCLTSCGCGIGPDILSL